MRFILEKAVLFHRETDVRTGNPKLCSDAGMSTTTTIPESVVNCVSNTIKVMRSKQELMSGGDNMELEARFGTVTSDGFNASVNENFMQSCLMAMQNYTGWEKVSNWTLETVFHYRDAQGRQLRTSRMETEEGGHGLVHICKKTTSKHDISILHGNKNFDIHLPTHLRVGLAEEVVVSEEELPKSVLPHRVTYKFRKSFTYGSWKYDFTRKISGTSIGHVEQKQRDKDPCVYEIEIECTNPREYLSNNTDTHMAKSLLLKMINFFPCKTSFDIGG